MSMNILLNEITKTLSYSIRPICVTIQTGFLPSTPSIVHSMSTSRPSPQAFPLLHFCHLSAVIPLALVPRLSKRNLNIAFHALQKASLGISNHTKRESCVSRNTSTSQAASTGAMPKLNCVTKTKTANARMVSGEGKVHPIDRSFT